MNESSNHSDSPATDDINTNAALSVPERLLLAAKQFFLSDEYHQVSTRRIAEAAQVNTAMIRYYFGNNEGLYEEMIRAALTPILDALDSETLTTRQGYKPMIEVDSLADYRAMLDWGMAKKPWLPRFVMQILLEQKRQRRSIERRLLADLERDQDQRAGLASIRAPTLILWGGRDRVLHVADADLLASAIPSSRKHVFADLGHVPMVEAPDLVAAHCREFLRDIST